MATRYKIRTERDISDAALVVLGNTSGTNTGDQVGDGSTITGAGTVANPFVAHVIGSGGINRSIVITSGNVTAGAGAATDYVYLIAGAHTLTMPTAVSNTNRYTVKNNHSAAVTVNCTGAETIDGAASLSLGPEEAIDLISNNVNWFII